MSQQTLGNASQMKSLVFRQSTRADDKQISVICFDVLDDRVDDVVHVHHGGRCPAFFDELVTDGVDQAGCSLHDGLRERGYLRGR